MRPATETHCVRCNVKPTVPRKDRNEISRDPATLQQDLHSSPDHHGAVVSFVVRWARLGGAIFTTLDVIALIAIIVAIPIALILWLMGWGAQRGIHPAGLVVAGALLILVSLLVRTLSRRAKRYPR